jgi:RimJ/RimL family protein N-acetyltransferase
MTHESNGTGAWQLSDGRVGICPPRSGDAELLVAGRDEEWERWLGTGDEVPHPTASVIVAGELVGWVDYDTDRNWLKPGEVNVGYNIFAAHRRRGYAARAVTLLLQYLAESTNVERAYLAIDAENAASLGVAGAIGAVEVERYTNEAGRLNLRFVVPVERYRGSQHAPR